jgi:hypothetical protein
MSYWYTATVWLNGAPTVYTGHGESEEDAVNDVGYLDANNEIDLNDLIDMCTKLNVQLEVMVCREYTKVLYKFVDKSSVEVTEHPSEDITLSTGEHDTRGLASQLDPPL